MAMTIELMDAKRKKTIGILSFVPLVMLIITLLYHLLLFDDQIVNQTMEDHMAMNTETAKNFGMLTVLYGLFGLSAGIALIYFVIHLLKLTDMTAGNKAVWVIVLATFMPVSFPLFWFMQILKEPKELVVNDSIK